MSTVKGNNRQLSPADQWLEKYGDILYRYALLRIKDPATAEDLVQETLVAGLKSRSQFAGRSSESTWLVGILKNKILDHLRKYLREQPGDDAVLEDKVEQEYFNAAGHWKSAPNFWQHPEQALEQKQFWKIFEKCADDIPERQARLFRLCELDGLSAKEAGKVLGITPSNVWVALHRARLKLRDCLDKLWFSHERNT